MSFCIESEHGGLIVCTRCYSHNSMKLIYDEMIAGHRHSHADQISTSIIPHLHTPSLSSFTSAILSPFRIPASARYSTHQPQFLPLGFTDPSRSSFTGGTASVYLHPWEPILLFQAPVPLQSYQGGRSGRWVSVVETK